ncbi:SH3 domain-containing protein [Phycomyces nitens]|nr:SH3 domain-containing protein [Phycomyces nitens]
MASVPICCRVRALYSFNSNDPASLTFEENDQIDVLNKLDSGWWDGWCSGRRGWFPSNYVQVIEEYDDDNTNSIQGDVLEEVIREEPILRRNNEYRLSLASQGPSSGWTLQQTEDGSDCYFYNQATGEMRSSHPGTTEDLKVTSIDNNQDDDEQRPTEGPIWDAVRAGLVLEDQELQAQVI